MDPLVMNQCNMQVSLILQHSFRKIPKWIGKTNIFWPHKYGYIVNKYFFVKNNPYVCKFHLENGNLKKLFKKHIEFVETLQLSLKLFSDDRANFSISFDLKKHCGLKNRAAETWLVRFVKSLLLHIMDWKLLLKKFATTYKNYYLLWYPWM